VIAVDTNILVYAHREDSSWHDTARGAMTGLAEGRAAWAIAWPSLHEFLAIVTHPRIYQPPTPLAAALDQVAAWLESPSLVLLAEAAGYWEQLKPLLETSRVSGPQIHDARITAICLQHGVSELWTADRDFSRFAGLFIRNPLVSA
jgi:toxin-antitoxin system PIN domain toxin